MIKSKLFELSPVSLSNSKTAFVVNQKCFCSEKFCEVSGIAPLSFVTIANGDKEFICQLHWKKVGDPVIEFNSDVFQILPEESGICSIQKLKVKTASSVTIDLITSDIQSVKKLRQYLSISEINKNSLCVSVLYKICVKHGFVVITENTSVGKLSNLFCIYVKNSSDKIINEGLIISKDTNFNVENIKSKQRFFSEQNTLEEIDLAGVEYILKELTEFMQVPLQRKQSCFKPPRCILLRGPPGTGKTTLVKLAAQKCNCFVVTINGPEIQGSRPGECEENMEKIFQNVILHSEEGLCVLFIDEIDSLCPNRKLFEGAQEKRNTIKVAQFLDTVNQMELPVAVIAATNRPMFLDPILRRPGRIDKEIIVSVPNHKQRKAILSLHTKKHPVESLDLDHLADITNGYVGADLASLCREAVYLAFTGQYSSNKNVSMEHFKEAAKKVQPSLQKGGEGFIDSLLVTWDDIGGLSNIKIQVQQVIEWPFKHPEAFKRMGLPCPKGLLLYGPPGCCKTKLIQAAAKSCNATFLSLSGAQLYSPFVGDSERMITELFQRARSGAPSIIFLDEIDSIIGKRGDGSSHRSVQERVLSTLLNEMDGIGIRLDEATSCQIQEGEQVPSSNIMFVAATNRPDLIDEALLRPGRIDRIIYVPVPDKDARKEILGIYLSKMPCFDVDENYLADKTELYSGADIENLCREAGLAALTEDLNALHVTMDHFMVALSTVKPSLKSYAEGKFVEKFCFGVTKK